MSFRFCYLKSMHIYRPGIKVKIWIIFCKKESRVRTQLSVDARTLKTCLRKLHDLSYFMIAHRFFVYEPSYYATRIKVTICQIDSVMTLNSELCQSEFSVLCGRLIITLSKVCFLCIFIDHMIIQQRFNVLL